MFYIITPSSKHGLTYGSLKFGEVTWSRQESLQVILMLYKVPIRCYKKMRCLCEQSNREYNGICHEKIHVYKRILDSLPQASLLPPTMHGAQCRSIEIWIRGSSVSRH